jgi:hypothetical protein
MQRCAEQAHRADQNRDVRGATAPSVAIGKPLHRRSGGAE